MSTGYSLVKKRLDKAKAYKMGKANKTHGLYGTPTWKSWDSMKQRCTNKNAPDYCYYGAKGIEVRYKSILDFIGDVGLRPSRDYSIDRIDIKGHYESGNCEWVLKSENTKRQMRDRKLNATH